MQAILYALIQIIDLLSSVFIVLIIVQFIIGLLFSFNVINPSNQLLSQIFRSINLLLDPVLRPIRRFLPETGVIDFSPLVIIVLLHLIKIVLQSTLMGMV